MYSKRYWENIKKVVEQTPFVGKLFNKKILITGSNGLICSAVVDICDFLNREKNANIELILAGRSEERIKKRFPKLSSYRYEKYDALQATKFDFEVDYIIHGASNANPSVYASEPVETLLGNIVGINSLLEFARNKNARLLYLSSSEVYGQKEDNIPYSESDYGFVDILNQRSCYPMGKRASETLCISYKEEYGVDVVIARPGHIYGPSITDSDTRASAQFTRNALNGENIVMKSAGSQLRSYCYTLDCASAILTILINGVDGEAYNISNRNSVVTIRELAEKIAEIAGTEVIFKNPSDAEVKGYNLMSNSSLNAEKLEKLGWKALFDLESGVKDTIDVLKSY